MTAGYKAARWHGITGGCNLARKDLDMHQCVYRDGITLDPVTVSIGVPLDGPWMAADVWAGYFPVRCLCVGLCWVGCTQIMTFMSLNLTFLKLSRFGSL